ncbi:hypothetical protein IX51_02435 [uncultured archaeon]|nr:hypothetical protein IX51_02435 [uncultured archaeon]
MNNFASEIYGVLFILTCIILVYTSYTDVKKRTINSFIFLPVIALGAWFNVANGAPLFFAVIGILIFLATYLNTSLVIYPIIGVAFLAVSLYYIAGGEFAYGFTSLVMSLMFLIGFQERLFGIGDVKAMVALFFSFTEFPFTTPLITPIQIELAKVMPLSIVMLFNIAIVSLFFIPYLVILNRRKGSSIGLHSVTSVDYDEKTYSRNMAKFSLMDTPSGKVMVYKTPFMISVSVGFIITMLAGFWFVLL